MTSEDIENMLRGTTLKVYKFVLKEGPVGIREVQRGLKLSSPTLASYHLHKLEVAGLVKQGLEGYEVNRIFLRTLVRFRRMLIPKYLFFFIFFFCALFIELVVFKPRVLTRGYVFAVVVTLVAALSYLYETIQAFLKEAI
jgi:DNA-binding transcriptional ArsR family regulator